MNARGRVNQWVNPKDWHVDLATDYVTHMPTNIGFDVGFAPRDFETDGVTAEDFVAEPVHFPAWGEIPDYSELVVLCQTAAAVFAERRLAQMLKETVTQPLPITDEDAMSKKLASFVHTGASFALPLIAVIAFASNRPHHHVVIPELPPPPAAATQTDVPATVVQLAAQQAPHFGFDLKSRLLYLAAGVVLGALVGAFFSDRLRRFRRLLGLAIGVISLMIVIFVHDYLAFGVGAVTACITVLRLLRDKLRGDFEPIFGNAHTATYDEISAANLVPTYDPIAKQFAQAPPGIPVGFTC